MSKKKFATFCLASSLNKARKEVARLQRSASPSAVHDARVALRRSRTLARAYEPLLKCGSTSVQASFRRLSYFLGMARDCYSAKKLLRRFAGARSPAVLVALVRHLERREARAIAEARRLIPGVLHAERNFSRRLDCSGEVPKCSDSYLNWLRKRLLKRCGKLAVSIEAVRNETSPSLHRSRIELKKIRYLTDTITSHNQRKDDLQKRVKEAQGRLGVIHDLLWLEAQMSQKSNEAEFVRACIRKESRKTYQDFEKILSDLPSKLKRKISRLR